MFPAGPMKNICLLTLEPMEKNPVSNNVRANVGVLVGFTMACSITKLETQTNHNHLAFKLCMCLLTLQDF